jgi:hypothetical protein
MNEWEPSPLGSQWLVTRVAQSRIKYSCSAGHSPHRCSARSVCSQVPVGCRSAIPIAKQLFTFWSFCILGVENQRHDSNKFDFFDLWYFYLRFLLIKSFFWLRSLLINAPLLPTSFQGLIMKITYLIICLYTSVRFHEVLKVFINILKQR